MDTLSKPTILAMKKKAHGLKPVVLIGQAGLTESVLAEISSSLDCHELIKVKVNAEDRDARREMTDDICSQLDAQLIQSIGHTIVIYREAPEKD